MRTSTLLSFVAIAAVSYANAASIKRQIVSTPTKALHVASNGTVTVGAATGATLFELITSSPLGIPGELFALPSPSGILPPLPPIPHAFLQFSGSATLCGPTGPLVFLTSSSDTCAVSTGFSFAGNVLQASVAGSFQSCSGGPNQVVYTTVFNAASPPGCTDVQIVKSAVVTPLA